MLRSSSGGRWLSGCASASLNPTACIMRSGFRLLAQTDLGGHGNGGEGMGLLARNGRRTLFIAHESGPVNFSVVDVTEPSRPRLIHQARLPHQEVRSNSLAVCGELLAVAYQTLRAAGSPAGLELFDVSDPERPRAISFFDTSGPHSRGVHFVWFVDGEFAYVSTGMPDFEPVNAKDDQLVLIVDLRDPARPREDGRWWLPGTAAGEEPVARHSRHDSGFRAHNVNVYPEGPDRAYVGYLDAGVLILDIGDRSRPRLVSRLDHHPPLPGFTHTVLPLFGRGLLIVTDEATRPKGEDWPKLTWVVDANEETNPVIVGSLPLPPIEKYAQRTARFGAHNIHENYPVETSFRSEQLIFGAFFSMGIRVYDVSNPFHPEEVGYYVPPKPEGGRLDAIH